MIRNIEKDAMELLLAGDDPTVRSLRKQYECAIISSIHMTGVGVYIYYNIVMNEFQLPLKHRFCFGDIEGILFPSEQRIGFLLWINSGLISFLEIYTYNEPWPEFIHDFRLQYIGGNRDMNDLKKSWDDL